MWTKDQANIINHCLSNPRPYEPDFKVPNIPEFAYVSTKFVKRLNPLTNVDEYVMVPTRPAKRIKNPTTGEVSYIPW